MRAVAAELVRFSRRNTLSAAGGFVGLLIIVVALAAPLLQRDPLKADFRRMNKPPDAQSLLGTDQVGRDTLSRVIYGARTSLFVAFSAVILGTTVGSLWGVAYNLRGRFDLVSQRIMEVLEHLSISSWPWPSPWPWDRPARGDLRHRHHPHSLRRPRHPLGGAVDPRAALRRGGTGQRRLDPADHGPARPAPVHRALPGAGHHAPRRGHRDRGRARWASACRRPRRRGATCWPIRSPRWSRRGGWRSFPAWPSPSPCWRSTCSVMVCHDTLDPRLSPAFLRMMAGGRRT